MIEFTCPGCRSSHLANEAFVGLRARCVVCGAFIRIPHTSGGVAEGTSAPSPARPRATARARSGAPSKPTRPAAARPAPTAPSSGTDADLIDLADFDDEVLTLEPPAAKPKPRAGAKAGGATRPDPYREAARDPGVEDDDEDEEDTLTEEPQPAKKRPDTALPAPPDRRKQLNRIGVAAAAIVCVALGGYFAFSGEGKPSAQAKAPPAPPPPPVKEEPKPTPPAPKKSEPRLAGPALAPPPRPAGPPIPLTAARLLAVRAEGSADFEGTHLGKRLLVRGTVGRVQGGVVNLSDVLLDVRDANAGIVCQIADSVPKPEPQPGQPVTILGVYGGNLRMMECSVVSAGHPADEEYKDKEIELTGLIARVKPEGDAVERFPSLELEAPTTDTPLAVQFLFRLGDKEQLAKLRPGQPVTVRGRCGGRSFRAVRFHDCAIVAPENAPAAAVSRVALDRFFAAYEADLLAADRPDPSAGPLTLDAEQLAATFGQNLALANATYRNRAVQVTGRVLTLQPATRTVVLETGTSQRYQILVAFTSARYVALGDEAVLTVRGTCAGVRGAQIRIENAERTDTGTPDTTVPRTTADFFPLQPGRELTYDLLEPAKTRENPIRRVAIRAVAPDLLELVPLKSGTFPAATLFGGDTGLRPKWARDLTKQKIAPQVMQRRVNNNVVELREVPPAPAQPSQWWDPVLKLGIKAGDGWSTEAPDGRTIWYTAASFGKDADGRDTLIIHRMAKNPKTPNVWEEWAVTYVRGVGEVKRVVSWHASNGKGVTVLEKKIVEGEDEAKKPDLKKDGK